MSISRKRSESGSVPVSDATPSDQRPREEKSAIYRDPRYEPLLAVKGSFMRKSEGGVVDTSKRLCRALLEVPQGVPHDTLFRDDVFERTCENISNRNEARVLRDITCLIVPSAETLATYGATNLDCLVDSVNEGWNNSIPMTKTRPQPDYSVGFNRQAFTDDQLARIQPFVGELTDTSYFMATYYMYFPFLTCEVKCGSTGLNIADRQNAHSMTLAVRAVVELFRLVGRQKELDREIIAFSISHDHRNVRIYGHYAVIDANETTFYRHVVHEFSFAALDGKEKWTVYKFTKNVYDVWMPTHLKRICSIIDTLPLDPDFWVSQSELHFPEHSGLSQQFGTHHLAQSTTDSAIPLAEVDSQQVTSSPKMLLRTLL